MRRGIATAILSAALTTLASSGCLSVRWSAYEDFVVIPESVTSDLLEPGTTDLGTCLDRLGAPLLVYEQPDEAFAVAYGWYTERDLGAQVSYPIIDFLSASVDYQDTDQKLHGLVLFFDGDGTLVRWRRGYLREVLPGRRRRPTAHTGA